METLTAGRRWVCNSSPLIVLGKVGLIGLLPQLAQDLIIPRSVADEITQGPASDAARLWVNGPGCDWVVEDAVVPSSAPANVPMRGTHDCGCRF